MVSPSTRGLRTTRPHSGFTLGTSSRGKGDEPFLGGNALLYYKRGRQEYYVMSRYKDNERGRNTKKGNMLAITGTYRRGAASSAQTHMQAFGLD